MLRDELYDAIREIPVIDVHSHLRPDRLVSRGPKSVLLYHMLLYILRSAGADETTFFRGRRGPEQSDGPFPAEQFLAGWPAVSRTGFGWALRTMLRELFDFDEPITAASLPGLLERMEAKSAEEGREAELLEAGRFVRLLSSAYVPEYHGEGHPVLVPTVEVDYGTNYREWMLWPAAYRRRLAHRHEHHHQKPRREIPEHLKRKPVEVHSMDELRDAIRDRAAKQPWAGRETWVCWISSDADFTPQPEERIEGLLARAFESEPLSVEERRLVNAAGIRQSLDIVRPHVKNVQFCFGCQGLTHSEIRHHVQRQAPQFASGLGFLFDEYADLHFNILNGYEPDEPILAAHCVAYNNVSMGSGWWHLFYPSVLHNAWARRLDVAPDTRLCGFFSDGYCLEWVFARLRLTQRVLANVLAERIERGFTNREEALVSARNLLFDTPRSLFLPDLPIDA